MSRALAIEVSAPLDPAWQPGAVDGVIDGFLARLNDGLAHLGIRAEHTSALLAGQDCFVIGRVVLVDDDGSPAVDAFECNPLGHVGSSTSAVNHQPGATPIPSKTGGAA